MAGDFSHGASEVHVDVVDFLFGDEVGHRLSERTRVGPVQLYGAGLLIVVETGKSECLLVALDQPPGSDHL